MKPKRRASFPSRGGILNGRRRPVDALTLSARARAIARRRRAAMEIGFMEGEAADFVHAIPLKGKHLREPIHARDNVSPSRVINNKEGFEFDSLSTVWAARIRRFQRTLPVKDALKHTSVDRAAFVLADTIRFFGNHYGKTTAQQLALNYLSGASITSPRVPSELAVERAEFLPFFRRLNPFIEGRTHRLHETNRLRAEAANAGYRLVKRRKQ